jgi:hypothetical protein
MRTRLWDATAEAIGALDSTASLTLATGLPFESTREVIVIEPSWLVPMCVSSAPTVASRTLDEAFTVTERTGLTARLVILCHG